MLLEKTLKGISDDKKIKEQRGTAVKNLLNGYMTVAGPLDALPNLTDENTGKELKDAIGHLWAQSQVVLLYRYLKDTNVIDDDLRDEREDKKLKRWIKKVSFVSILIFVAFILMTIGAMIVFNHQPTVDAKTGSNLFVDFLETAFEIIKLLLGG